MSFFRFVFSELFHSKRFVFLFLLNLSLGLTSFVALEFLKTSVDATVSAQSRQVLGADLGVSSRRVLKDQEWETVEAVLPASHQATNIIEMFSMVSKNSASSLVQIKAIDMSFPYYGQVLTNPIKKTKDLEDATSIWVYPEILTLLNAAIGDTLKVGDREFRIAAIVEDDAASGISTGMAPRIYMSREALQKTNLLRAGTLAWYVRLYKLPNVEDMALEDLRDQIFKKIPSSDVQVYTHKNASEQTARLLNYLGDFLGLVSLAALFIACIGLTFLLSTYIQIKSKSIAILNAVGFSRQRALFFYFVQFIILIGLGSIISVAVAAFVLPVIMKASQSVAPFAIRPTMNFQSLGLSLALGLVGGLFLILPHLMRLYRTNPNQLLRGAQWQKMQWTWLQYMTFIPSFVLFYFLSIRQMHSFKNGSIFFASFVGAGLVLYSLAYGLLPILGKIDSIKWIPLRWALRDITRLRMVTVTGFLSLALGVFLVNIVPQIKANIEAEIQRPAGSKIPSLFLFDIQSEQVEELRVLLKKEKIALNNISPLIRARLIEVNGLPFSKGEGASAKGTSREEEQEASFRNRGFNLSYREELDSSETLVAGAPLPKTFDSSKTDTIAEISLEIRFAQRLNLKIGDVLTFDIQETPMRGKITSFRKVNWTSFQPNFFVLFQSGSLEDAPKTFLATIPKIPLEQKVSMQKSIVQKMPNVSLIDVDRLIKKLMTLVEQMGWALQVMSAFCILVGLTVLLALANDQIRSREWDIGLLKALGTQHSQIALCFILQFTIISVAAALAGGLLSLLGSYIFSYFLFDGSWSFNWQVPLLILVFIALLSPLLIFFGVRRGLQFSARELLTQ